MFFKVGVPKSFAIFAGKSLCWNLFLIKLQVWRLAISMKKWLQHRCFPANPTQVFSCEYCKKFDHSFFYRTSTVATFAIGRSRSGVTGVNQGNEEKGSESKISLCYPRGLRFPSDLPTVQKINFSVKVFFSKYDQIRRKLRIWSHLLKKYLMENLIFCAVAAREGA